MKILSFDLEDWYHLLDVDFIRDPKGWDNFESRFDYSANLIIDLLLKHNINATFFSLGWIAKRHPKIIKRLTDNGWEVGTHSHIHSLVHEQSLEEFSAELKQSVDAIEHITGKKVISFRAPGFSITKDCLWAFDVLKETGIEHDCSSLPAHHAHGGLGETWPTRPFVIETKNGNLKSFPISVKPFIGKNLIYSGGGYFRLLPYILIKNWMKNSEYVMTYFHPRDFDAGQPILHGISKKRIFKAYVGIKGALRKLDKLANEFDFIDLDEANKRINWKESAVVNLRERS